MLAIASDMCTLLGLAPRSLRTVLAVPRHTRGHAYRGSLPGNEGKHGNLPGLWAHTVPYVREGGCTSAKPKIDRAPSPSEEGAHARAVRFLLRLQRVTEALTPQLRTDEIARTIVDAATQVLGADIAGLFMPDGDVLQPIARSGDPTETSWDGAAEVALDSPLAIAEAFRSGRTIWAPRNEEWRRLFPSAPPHYHRDVEGVLAVPLRSDGEAARGVLGALFRRPDALDEDERRLATTIGQQAAQAIERARLFESERDLADRATALREVAAGLAAAVAAGDVAEVLVGAAAQAVGAQAAAVGLVDLDTDTVGLARTVGADPIDIERCVRSGSAGPGLRPWPAADPCGIPGWSAAPIGVPRPARHHRGRR